MIIEIDDELFQKVKQIVKDRNKSICEQLEKIKPFDTVATNNTLQEAREIKTQRVKENIKATIKSLISANISPTKYQVHKLTNIAYVTLNKYYDEIIDEVKNENR